jgi:maleylpyruvate isomerase
VRDLLDEVARAEARLALTVAGMTDADAAEPSRLPGWTRAMLVTHLARNASSNAAMVAAALRGESRPQYPGGPDQRAAEIEAGRGRPAVAVRDDLRTSAAAWAAVMATVSDWDVVVLAGVGPRPVSQRVRSRLFEVEVHHADLGLGYTFRDWPEPFAARELDRAVARLGDAASAVAGGVRGDGGEVRGDPRALLAWLLGRETVTSAGLAVTGDPKVADLPAKFPFP